MNKLQTNLIANELNCKPNFDIELIQLFENGLKIKSKILHTLHISKTQ